MLSLEGRVAIVTGGAQGIGRATVMALANAGAKIALTNIRCAKLDQTIQELKDMGREALKFCVDVTDVEAVQEMVDQTIATWGKIDILVNNAGITKDNLVMRMKTADWEAVLKTNLDGTFYCTRAVLPTMVRQRWGRIINIASVVAQTGNVGQANYIASKAGIIGLTKSLAKELGPRTIRVNAVAPGYIDTAMTQALAAEVRQAIVDATPLRSIGRPSDVANAVLFLASPLSRYITGCTLPVDGGLGMGH